MSNQEDWNEIGTGETWDQSEPVQGIYINKQEDVGPNSSMMYTLRTAEGDVGIWGGTVLDQKFSQIQLGQEVRVEFTGLSKEKGKFGKPWKTYKVLARTAPMKEVGGSDEALNLDDINY